MNRTHVATIVALAALFAVQTPYASAAGNLVFSSPAQVGGEVTVLASGRILVVLPVSGVGSLESEVHGEFSDFENLTWEILAAVTPQAVVVYPREESQRSAADWQRLGITATRYASIYIEAESIRLTGDAAGSLFNVAGPITLLEATASIQESQGVFHNRKVDADNVFSLSKFQAGQIEAKGIRYLQWFNADVTCDGGAAACPSGGGERFEKVDSGAGVYAVRHRHFYESVAARSASARLSFSNAFAFVEAANLDVTTSGFARLPMASGATQCDGCVMPANQTLMISGNVSLADVRKGDGRMEAQVGGDLQEARIDETSVEPSTLGLYAKPALVSAAVAGGLFVAAKILLATLFTRRKGDPLDHPRRKAIYDYVCAHPGATFREVAREVSLAAGTARHHLTVLRRAGLLVEHPYRSSVRFFENHGKYAKNWRETILLREPSLAQLEDWIKANPGAAQKDVLDAMARHGWSRSTTQHRLSRLVAEGLAHAVPSGRLLHYKPGPRPRPLEPASPSSLPAWAERRTVPA